MDSLQSSLIAWHQTIDETNFKPVDDPFDAIPSKRAKCQQIASHLDKIVAETLKNFYFDNSPSEFLAFYEKHQKEIPNMKEAYATFAKTFQFKTSLKERGGDECLGLALDSLKRMARLFSNSSLFDSLYDIDFDEDFIIENQINDENICLNIKFRALDKTIIKISAYIVGFLANTVHLGYYHFSTMLKIQEIRENTTQELIFIVDPGEAMSKSYSCKPTDVGIGSAQTTSLNNKKELLKTPYFNWVASNPDMQRLIQQHGICVEGFWRRAQNAVVIDRALNLQQLEILHQRLPFFLLYPKLIHFNPSSGQIDAHISWNLLEGKIKVRFLTENYEISNEQLGFWIEGGDSPVKVPFNVFVEYWKAGTSDPQKREHIFRETLRLSHAYLNKFACEMVDANYLREDIPKIVIEKVKAVGEERFRGALKKTPSKLEELVASMSLVQECTSAIKGVFMNLQSGMVIPEFVKQIAATQFKPEAVK